MEDDPCECKYFMVQEILVTSGAWIEFKKQGEICMSLLKSRVINVQDQLVEK